MKEERKIMQFDRTPVKRISWSAIFAGAFFAFGVMLLLGLFGLAIGARAIGPTGLVGTGVNVWPGIWSAATAFLSFLCGGWLAARVAGTQSSTDGMFQGLTLWGLGNLAVLYFAVTSAGRVASLLAVSEINLPPIETGAISGATTMAALWALSVGISGLIGAVAGGYAGGYRESASVVEYRRAA